MMNYDEFVATKVAQHSFDDCPRSGEINETLFPHQRLLVDWALRRGRAAVFADTGLGKTRIEVEWARHVASAGRVLLLAPLAVAEQTVQEAAAIGVDIEYTRDPAASRCPIVITNYDMLEHFTREAWSGVVLDESSILKSFTGKTRNALIDHFAAVPFKLCATATPAPNDYTELGNHSEFLGIKSRVEMLAEYFTHDGGQTSIWRLKGHAQEPFWRWVCSWAAAVKRPSDLGFDDGGYALPPLNMHEHVIDVDHKEAHREGYLFAPPVKTLSDQRATRRMTMRKRAELAAELCSGAGPALVWCELNDEADQCEALIDGAIQVAGSDKIEQKRERLLGFAAGKYRVMVTKSGIAGFGLNWQHCNRMVFVGASHSYEQTYQAIRRCWRFGQQRPVDVHIIRAETEGAIIANFRRKEAEAERLSSKMVSLMRDSMGEELGAARREMNAYDPQATMIVPQWIG